MTARRFWPTFAITAFFLVACQPGAEEADPSEDEAPAIPVETATATRGDIFAVYSGTAPIEAFADATVIAKVGGEVRDILVEEGDDVSSGDVLARLDGDRLRLEMEQAEANLRKLQRDYQRNLDLKDRGLISAVRDGSAAGHLRPGSAGTWLHRDSRTDRWRNFGKIYQGR